MFDGLTSGALGLIAGSVAGLLLSALFEDYLVSCRKALIRLGRHFRSRTRPGDVHDDFSLGPLRVPLYVIEGDGSQVINEQSCQIVIDPEEVRLPPEMEQWRDDIVATQAFRKLKGEPFYWNGLRYAVESFSVSRTIIDESPEVCVRLKLADYYTFLAAQQLDRPLADGTTARQRYVDLRLPEQVPSFLRCSFGTHVAMVSADDKVVFARRSSVVGSRPGVWNSSANEGLSRSLDSQGRSPPNLYDVARRGVAEELSIGQDEYRLELLAFAIDVRLQQWCALFVAFAHDLTGQEILDRRTRGTPDKWENDLLELERFDVEHVIRYLLRPDRREHWAPAAPALFYFSLVRRYGRVRVEYQTARLLRKLRLPSDSRAPATSA